MKSTKSKTIKHARRLFKKHNGILKTGQALAKGIHPRTLYQMRDEGLIEPLARGLYKLADVPDPGDSDLVTVALKVPKGVICLISALYFHDLTTEIPHEVYLALPQGNNKKPTLEYPPLRYFWFSGAAYTEGVEEHSLDGIPVKIYCREKTVADCFKFRNQIGLDVAIDSLKDYLRQKPRNTELLYHYAKICRVHNVMRPYLESLL